MVNYDHVVYIGLMDGYDAITAVGGPKKGGAMRAGAERRNQHIGTERPRPSRRIVEKLNGEACWCCGARHYYLVFRMKSGEGERARLAARCSRCHEQRDLFSIEQLVRDMNDMCAKPGYASVS